MGSIGLVWDEDLRKNLDTIQARFERAALISTERMAPTVENYMKLNAPWTDQTTNARNGLAARAYRDGKEFGIILFHQVDYGLWLEVRFNGKYAIINPTIEVVGPRVMRNFEGLLDRLT